jgi:hypothetical protein
MHFRGQTAALSTIFVLVGMVFLVPAITEKALASIKAVVTGTCGPEGAHGCLFVLASKHLRSGMWQQDPPSNVNRAEWKTIGAIAGPSGMVPGEGNEAGSVIYKVSPLSGLGEVELYFDNPLIGSNKCEVAILSGQGLSGTCNAGKGYDAEFTYTLRSDKPCLLSPPDRDGYNWCN